MKDTLSKKRNRVTIIVAVVIFIIAIIIGVVVLTRRVGNQPTSSVSNNEVSESADVAPTSDQQSELNKARSQTVLNGISSSGNKDNPSDIKSQGDITLQNIDAALNNLSPDDFSEKSFDFENLTN